MEALSEVVYLGESGLFCRKFINSYLYISVKKNRYEELYQNHDRVEQTSFFFNDLIFLNSSFCLLKKLYFLSVRQCEQDPCIWVSIIMPGSLDV